MNRTLLQTAVFVGCVFWAGFGLASGADSQNPTGAEAAPAEGRPPRAAVPPGSDQLAAALERARSLVNQDRLEDSEIAARQILKDHGDVADAHFLLGYVLFRQIQAATRLEGGSHLSQYDQFGPALENRVRSKAVASLAEYTAGARFKTPSAFHLKIVAMNYVVLGDYADADRWLTRSLQWDPNDAEAWYYLGRAKYNLNRFEEAVEAFRKSLALRPEDAKAFDNLGLSYEGLGRGEEAIAAYRKAIALGEAGAAKNPGPYLNLGGYLLEHNKPADALPYLVDAAAISPRESRVHERLGKAYTQLNRLPDAKAELETAVRLAPENAALHYMLGQVLRRMGDREGAAAELKRSEELRGPRSSP
jgi:tetratricopeptide (TPR) repeat protein